MVVDNKFDGDQLNVTLAVDEFTWEGFMRHLPHLGIYDRSSPRKISGVNAQTIPTIAMFNNYLKHHNSRFNIS